MAAHKATIEAGKKDLSIHIVKSEEADSNAMGQSRADTLTKPTFTSSLRNACRYKIAIIFISLLAAGNVIQEFIVKHRLFNQLAD